MGQMNRICEKSTGSEFVVRNITKDIQVLDLAKKNLIHSMTTLKRLQMLGMSRQSPSRYPAEVRPVNALTQVEGMIPEKHYAEIAQTLAVRPIPSSR